VVQKYTKFAIKTEQFNFNLPGTIIKVRICNICEIVSIQVQRGQLLSKFVDNMDYIIIIKLCHAFQSHFFQVLATVGNKADVFPT